MRFTPGLTLIAAPTSERRKPYPLQLVLALVALPFQWLIRVLRGQLPTVYFTKIYAPLWFTVVGLGVAWTITKVPNTESKRKYVISHLMWQERNPEGYRIMACALMAGALIHLPVPAWLYRHCPARSRVRRSARLLMSASIFGLFLLGIESGFWPELAKWHRHAHALYAVIAFGGFFFGAILFNRAIVNAPIRTMGLRAGSASLTFSYFMMWFGAASYILLEVLTSSRMWGENHVHPSLHWLLNFAVWEWCMVFSIVFMITLTLRKAARSSDLAAA